MPEILSIGECMVEFFAEEPLATARVFYKAFAGDALNLLAAAARLGSTTGFISRVGDDPFQPFLLKGWQELGIDTSHVKRVEGCNGIYFISIAREGQREFIYYRKGSAPSTLVPEDLDSAYIAQARFLHVSGITQAISPTARATVLAAARMAKEAGVQVSYDPNLRLRLWTLAEARAAMSEVLPYVDTILPSGPEEAQALFGTAEPEAVARWLHARGPSLVALKLGEHGVFVSGQGEQTLVPALPVEQVVDTTGAGDVFDGAFLHGLVRGLSPRQAARLGVSMAGLKVRGRGAIASLPSREEVEAMFAAQ